jgi:hypothetical protein
MQSDDEGMAICRTPVSLATDVDGVIRRFCRFHKYGLGSGVRDATLSLVLLVARFNHREERARAFVDPCWRAEELKVLCLFIQPVQKVSLEASP